MPDQHGHEMPASAATAIVTAVQGAGVAVVVGGGWAVDALLREQTRPHSDLDLWLRADHYEHLVRGLAGIGLDRLYPWGGDRPWNFVVHDGAALRVDLHVYEPIDATMLHYGSAVHGESFPAAALEGQGVIAGTPVACEAPEWSLRWHSGYPLRERDRHDVARLCDRFGFDLPEDHR